MQRVQPLLAELRAHRFDSATTQRLLHGGNGRPRLLRACYAVRAGQITRARDDIEHAIEQGSGAPDVWLVSGLLLFVTRDYQRALQHLTQVMTLANSDADARSDALVYSARQHLVDMTSRLGWEHDARRVLEAAVEATPPGHSERRALWHAQLTRLFVGGRHWQPALDHARHALRALPEHASLWMEAAGLHARLGQRQPAVDALDRAIALAEPDRALDYLREGIRVSIDAGDFARAHTCIDRALELDPRAPDLFIHRADLHLFAGDLAAARREAETARSLDARCAAAVRIAGALEVLAGSHASAVPLLEQALALDPTEYQAAVWLAQAHLRLGRPDDVDAPLRRATMSAPGFLFVSWLLRALAQTQQEAPHRRVPPHRTEEFEHALLELCPAEAKRALETRRFDDLGTAIEAALDAMKGNRSIYATYVADGVLTRCTTRTGCRHHCRWGLQLLRVASGQECLQQFEAILERYPQASLTYCHRGELHLWLGDRAAARADLQAAIDRVCGTRWAYMGLSMLALLDGDPHGCLDINARGVRQMGNTEGDAIYGYRGEALRRLGRLDEAREQLERAVACHPSRASATINLALCHAARGDGSAMQPLWRRLRDEQAPGLLSDAAYERGVTIYGDTGWEPDDATKVEVLTHALAMMGGNRSSGLLTYHTAQGQLRTVPQWPSGGRQPHADDDRRLRQAAQIVLQAMTA